MSLPIAGVDFWEEPQQGFDAECEIVVIGSGAGGAFAALTFAEAGFDTILLEEGFRWRSEEHSPDVSVSTGRMFAEGALRTAQGTPPMPVAGGKALGGSTVVNSAISFRTPESVLAEWNERSAGAFADTAAFYRTMDAVEAMVSVEPTPDRLLSGYDRLHKEAALALGWSNHNFRRNTPRCAGCGRCNMGCPVSGKASVDFAVLPRAAAAGLRVITGAEVRFVAPGQADGVVVGRDAAERGPFRVRAKHAVVLSGGAVASPRLLLDSAAVPEGGEVGGGLLLHPVFTVLSFHEDRVIAAPGSTQGHYVDEFHEQRVILESNPTLAGVIFPSMPFWGKDAWPMLGKGSNFSSTGVMVRDEHPGRIVGSRSRAARVRYDISDADKARAIFGMTRAAELWLHGAQADFVTLNLYGGDACRTMDDVSRLLTDLPTGRLIGYSSHPQASCSVGRACREDGEVIGADGLYVMDAGSLPLNVGRNPQISVMTVARTLAARLSSKLGRTPAPLHLTADPPRSVPQAGVPCGLTGLEATP